MVHDDYHRVLKELTDNDGRPLFYASEQVGNLDRIGRYPLVVNQDMNSQADNVKSILFGDFSYYRIRDVGDLTLLRLGERYIEELQVAFIGFWRTDGVLLDPNAVKYVTSGSGTG
jgi:HK97 family phage major capsid protein